MNSFHEQCPNSDCKQCTESELGWVYSAHTQSPGRAHTARAVPMSWALLRSQQAGRAHVARTASAGRAQRAQVARIAPRSWVQVATSFRCPVQARSRHRFQVATSWKLTHVATSNWCRDTTQSTSGRDLKTGSRHRFSCPASSQVATLEPGRDPPGDSPMSRHQFHVATSFPNRPGRDVSSMSRPPGDQPMSQHQFHVATSFLPTVGFPGRDAKLQVTTSHTPTHVATSKMMSRPQLSSAPFLLCRDSIFFFHVATSLAATHVATSIPTGQNPRSSILRPTTTQPGRDATSWSRPHIQPNQVATSNPCRDLNRS